MADKSAQIVLNALSKAVADPAGLPLHGSKAHPGLFAANNSARQAAQQSKDEGYLRVVRTESHGKTTQEICAITEKGLAYLLGQVSPRKVLEDLVRMLQSRQNEAGELLVSARHMQAGLDQLKATAEKVLQSLSSGQNSVSSGHGAGTGGSRNGTPASNGEARNGRRHGGTTVDESHPRLSGPLAGIRGVGRLPAVRTLSTDLQDRPGLDHRSVPRRSASPARPAANLSAPLDWPHVRHPRTALRAARGA